MERTFTANQFSEVGLRLLGITSCRLEKLGDRQSEEMFVSNFGVDSDVCAHVWEYIKPKTNEDKLRPVHLLLGLYFLKIYPTEIQMSVAFNISVRSVRKWVWETVERICALKNCQVSMGSPIERNFSPFVSHINIVVVSFWKQIFWPDEWDPDHSDFKDCPYFFISIHILI